MISNSLDKLHDIYTPSPIGFEWTQGMSLLVIFLVSTVITSLYLYISYLYATRFKRSALSELKLFKQNDDISAVFMLVKRVLLTVHKREEVANLSGDELLRFIDATKSMQIANSSIYNGSVILNELEKKEFYKDVSIWIKKQRAIYD